MYLEPQLHARACLQKTALMSNEFAGFAARRLLSLQAATAEEENRSRTAQTPAVVNSMARWPPSVDVSRFRTRITFVCKKKTEYCRHRMLRSKWYLVLSRIVRAHKNKKANVLRGQKANSPIALVLVGHLRVQVEGVELDCGSVQALKRRKLQSCLNSC